MTRDLSAGAITALSERVVRLEYLYEGVFEFNTLRLWTGLGDLSWDSKTWLGNGWLLKPAAAKESLQISANSFSVVLSGVPDTVIQIALAQTAHTGDGSLYIALFDSDEALIDTYPLSGDLDKVQIGDAPTSSTVSFSYTTKLRRLKVSRDLRMTNEYQQSEYPGDKGLEQVSQIRQKRLYWGRPDPGRWGG